MNHSVIRNQTQDLAHLRPEANDEIDLGQLIRNLIAQWKLIIIMTSFGALASISYALMVTPVFKVETIISAPTTDQLGNITEQTLIPIDTQSAFSGVISEVSRVTTQQEAFSESQLDNLYAKNSIDGNYQPLITFSQIRGKLKVEKLVFEYIELTNKEVAPLTDVKISFTTPYPKESLDLLNRLVEFSNRKALDTFEKKVTKTKSETLKELNQELTSLTTAAGESRAAKISRMTEANELKISQLQQRMDSLLENARQDRLNRVVQLTEALNTAKVLEIKEPVTWDDLRPAQRTSQITNDLSETTKPSPLYFQGTRILSAEIQRLKARTDDRPFIEEYSQLAQQIADLKNDTEIEALKNRTDDSIYIESFDTIKNKIAEVTSEPSSFSGVQFSQVSLQPLVPASPIAPNRKLIVAAGTVLAGFLALFIALIRIAMTPKEEV